MHWDIEKAKNGQNTLKLNGMYIYSKYNPKKEVESFMFKEVDFSKKKFIIVGLGLGYHIDFILENIEDAQVQYIVLDNNEEELYKQFSQNNFLNNSNVNKFIADKIFNNGAQIIIPQAFLRAIGEKHPLFSFIEDIKIRQISFNRFKEQMRANFKENIKLFKPLKKEQIGKKKAALISSGPSLNHTIGWLKQHEKEFDIYCVGSALNVVINADIIPNKIFITDAHENIMCQVETNYERIGELIFLSTANYRAVDKYKGEKQIIFQKGYFLAEQFAVKYNQPLFETGGSVATTAFSYIKWLGYEELYLFGQDLGFSGQKTHAENSTSGRTVTNDINILKIEANDGSLIYTTPNLMTYKRWFDQAFLKTSMKIINTAKKGAKINNTKFLDILHK